LKNPRSNPETGLVLFLLSGQRAGLFSSEFADLVVKSA
jgi:hypothetical protein